MSRSATPDTGRAGHPWDVPQMPVLAPDAWHAQVVRAADGGARLVGVWGWGPDAGAVELIAGTAHAPNMEKPAEFNRLVLDFLGGL